jgi:polysaccharide pyruvyl transferase WcaK-like protein
MAGLGAPGRAAALQPDVAFALPRPERREPVDGATREIGLGVMAYYGWGNDPIAGQPVFASYIASMTEIARRILASGHAVRLLIGEQTDIRAAEHVIAALGSRPGARMGHTVLFEPITTFDGLMAQIARTEAVVATRYHNVIAGLMTATPTISIGYADKNRAVMSSFGLEQHCHHVDGIDVDAVERDLFAVLDRGPYLRATMRDTADRLARQVDARFDATFAELVGDRARLSSTTG